MRKMKGVIALSRYRVLVLKAKDWILCILCAALLILPFSKLNIWILAWFGFVPLLFVIQNKSKGRAFLLSYLVGIIFWLGVIYWLNYVTFVGLVLLALYLALYFGLFGLVIVLTRGRVNALMRLFLIPSIWVLLEYVRSHLFTGFGWALLGYSQYLNLPIIQIANITGVWGVSFLVMMVNVLIYKVIAYRLKVIGEKQTSLLPFTSYLLPIFFLFLSFGYGFYQLHRTPSAEHRTPIKISVIQPNIPQSIKWQEYAKDEIWDRHLILTRKALRDKPDLIIWPEAALPGILEKEPRLEKNLKIFVRNIQIPLLVGAVNSDEDNYYNTAILISKSGEFIKRYDKLHLVPFGEYVPLKRAFGFLETIVPIGDFIPGEEYTVFAFDGLRKSQEATHFSVLICFEDLFPGISRQFVKQGAGFLVNITNDAWFGNTSSHYQHLSASIFRAVENNVYLARAANTGVSGFITPKGRVYPLIDNNSGKQTFISDYKTKDVYINHKQNSVYTRWGDWFVLVCGLIVLLRLWVKGKRLRVKG